MQKMALYPSILIMVADPKYIIILFTLFLCVPLDCFSQFHMPRFDVELKGSYVRMIDDDQGGIPAGGVDRINSINLQGAAHWQPNQHIAFGWFYCRSLSGEIRTIQFQGGDKKTGDAQLLMTGPEIRISAGRFANWRPYLTLNYCKMELINDQGGYRQASKTTAYGGSIGIMRRLSDRLYLNLIEVSVRVMQDIPYWFTHGDNTPFEAKSGLTFNFGKYK
jgi:hypothetical protein